MVTQKWADCRKVDFPPEIERMENTNYFPPLVVKSNLISATIITTQNTREKIHFCCWEADLSGQPDWELSAVFFHQRSRCRCCPEGGGSNDLC